jgi:DNA repair protein RecO (recombination protein O)
LQPAYIIHRRSYLNTSWLLEVLTQEYGLIALVAKGVRGPKSDKRALLQPFVQLLLSFSGRGELMTLTAAESLGSRRMLKGKALFAAMYINEILQTMLHRNDPHESIFSCYEKALMALVESEDSLEPVLRCFELELLIELGYGPQLAHEAITQDAILAGNAYHYDLERGPVNAATYSGAGAIVSGSCLLALQKKDFDDLALLKEMKILMRQLIHHHTGGRKLKSRELFAPLAKSD